MCQVVAIVWYWVGFVSLQACHSAEHAHVLPTLVMLKIVKTKWFISLAP